MFALYEAAQAYRSGRGSFLKLAAAAICNRIIDYRRKQLWHAGVLSLDLPEGTEDERSIGDQLADPRTDLRQHQNRADARQKIDHFVQ